MPTPPFAEGRRMLASTYLSSSMGEKDTAATGIPVRFGNAVTTAFGKGRGCWWPR